MISTYNEIAIWSVISPETRRLVEDYIRKSDVKEARFIETAILHHLQAVQELPEEIIVPPKIVVSSETGKKLKELLDNPPEPAMKALYESD